ncbi:MAG: cytochrome d ubiquinol oxidase subunit II [Alphaproteobacteria bacterium]
MTLFGDPNVWLPLTFAGLMGFAILVYVVLDGYDLGVGLLLAGASPAEKDRMIASIGPFWDANETWLVLAVGLLLVAFPVAHGVILSTLYVPVAVMLLGLILRGVAFEFRQKVSAERKGAWNAAFFTGSLMTALAQGYMLGRYVMGLEPGVVAEAFAALTAICVACGYAFIGSAWLIHKTEDELQLKAVRWARRSLWFVALGFVAISLASPLASPRIFAKWFALPEFILLAPLPLTAAAVFAATALILRRLPTTDDALNWAPFAGGVVLFALAFTGLAYSFYPYVVPDRITLFEAASAPESLAIILVGTLVIMPVILAYTAIAYVVFRGKATDLRYD